jgi:peptidoglycan/LPS O-acetylase OafA/YrhL
MRGVLVHALLLQDVIGSPSPNGAFWSIAIESQIYILFPLLVTLRRRCGAKPVCVATVAACLATYGLATTVGALERLLNLIPQFLALFVFGMMAIRDQHSAKRDVRWIWTASVLGAVAVLALSVLMGDRSTVAELFWFDLAVGASTALLLRGLADDERSTIRRWLGSVTARSIGRISYSVYLIHLPILTVVWVYGVLPMRPSPTVAFIMLVSLGVPSVIAGSWLFARYFEEPFIRFRSLAAWQSARRTRSAVTPRLAGPKAGELSH